MPITHCNERQAVKTLINCVGSIPFFRLDFGWHNDADRCAASQHAGPGSVLGVIPARRITIWPDDQILSLEWAPVGLVNGCLGSVHGGGGHDTQCNQSAGALFTFDQDNLAASRHSGKIEQWPRIRRAPHPAANVPRSEFLARGWVVAVDAGNQRALA